MKDSILIFCREEKMSLLRRYVSMLLEQNSKLSNVEIASMAAHRGQMRRSGEEYITHPFAVAQLMRKHYPGNSTLYNTALLHDTLEDAIDNNNVEDEAELFAIIANAVDSDAEAAKIIDLVSILTKYPGEDYDTYMQLLYKNPNALRVKLADMQHNLSSNPSPGQIKKYSKAVRSIEAVFQGRPDFINPGQWASLMELIQ